MIDILNLTFPELERFIVEDLGQPKFRAAQVWQWIWQKHATSFDAMTDVSKQLRAKLAEVAEIVLPEIVTVQTSCDGTEKLLLRLRDGALVDAVVAEPHTGHENLAQDFPGGHVADKAHRARAAKRAAHRAADLRRHALGDPDGTVLPRAREDDRLHQRAVPQPKQQFFRAVA